MKHAFHVTSTKHDTAPYGHRIIVLALYRQHRARLADLAAELLGEDNESSAEDAVQQVFADLLAGCYRVPAVDVRRKLDEALAIVCDEMDTEATEHRRAMAALAEARRRAEEASHRTRRLTRLRVVAPEDDEASEPR